MAGQMNYGEALDTAGSIGRATPPEWELFDLEEGAPEMNNVYTDAVYARVVVELKQELQQLREGLEDYE